MGLQFFPWKSSREVAAVPAVRRVVGFASRLESYAWELCPMKNFHANSRPLGFRVIGFKGAFRFLVAASQLRMKLHDYAKSYVGQDVGRAGHDHLTHL